MAQALSPNTPSSVASWQNPIQSTPTSTTKRAMGRTISPTAAAITYLEGAYNQQPPQLQTKVTTCMDEALRRKTLLGKGRESFIYKASLDSIDVALKIPQETEGLDGLKTEHEYLSRLSHASIVQILGLAFSQGKYALIMEYCPTDLYTYQKNNLAIPLKQKLHFFNDTLQAAIYLHSQRIFHGDYKVENILLTHDLMAKLCDFNLACSFDDPLGFNKSDIVFYMAPELFGFQFCKNQISGRMTPQTESYCLGYLLLTILSNKPDLSLTWDADKYGRLTSIFDRTLKKNLHYLSHQKYSTDEDTRVDPSLTGNHSLTAQGLYHTVIRPCMELTPAKRPSLQLVSKIISANLGPLKRRRQDKKEQI